MLEPITLLADSPGLASEALLWLAIVGGIILINNAILKKMFPENRFKVDSRRK